MFLSTCQKCGKSIPLGLDLSNGCEKCGEFFTVKNTEQVAPPPTADVQRLIKAAKLYLEYPPPFQGVDILEDELRKAIATCEQAPPPDQRAVEPQPNIPDLMTCVSVLYQRPEEGCQRVGTWLKHLANEAWIEGYALKCGISVASARQQFSGTIHTAGIAIAEGKGEGT
jgi:hypothetical protein